MVSRDRNPTGPARMLPVAGAGVVLLLAGLPLTLAGMTGDLARDVLRRSYDGQSIPVADLQVAARLLSLSVAAGGGAQAAGDLSRILMLEAVALDVDDPRRPELLVKAEDLVGESLADAPGQPSLWLRLATLRYWRGDRSGAAAALNLSVMSGAVAPALMTSRLEIGLALRDVMDDDDLALLRRQVILTAELDPDWIEAQRSGLHADFIAQALPILE